MPTRAQNAFAHAVGKPSATDARMLALECDDIDVLRAVVRECDSVLAAPHASVKADVAAGTLRQLRVTGLPDQSSDTGIVTLRGRTPSPMASLIIGRLPAAG